VSITRKELIQLALIILLSCVLIGLIAFYVYIGMQQAKVSSDTVIESPSPTQSNGVPPIDTSERRRKITEALQRQNDEVRGVVTTSVSTSTPAAILDSLDNQPTDLVRTAPSQQKIIDALHNQ
jgi:hypothetical protein